MAERITIEPVDVTRKNRTWRDEGVSVKGYVGTWYVVAYARVCGARVCLLEHEEYGDETAPIIVYDTGDRFELLLADAWNGWDDLEDAIENDDILFKDGLVYLAPAESIVCRRTVSEASLRNSVYSVLLDFLNDVMDSDSSVKVRDLILEEVVTDIKEASGFEDNGEFSLGDMRLAVGRVICKRLGIPED